MKKNQKNQKSDSKKQLKPEKYEKFKKESQELEKKQAKGFSLIKKILLGIAVLFLILGSYFAFLYKAEVKIQTSPEKATIKIDGEVVENQTIGLKPGAHEVVITQQGYETFSKKIMVNYFLNDPLKTNLKEIPLFKTLDEGNVSHLDYNNDKNNLFYIKNGAAYRLPLNSDKPKPKQISPKVFQDIKNLKWTVGHEGVLVQLKNSSLVNKKPFKTQRGKAGYSTWFYDFNRYNLLNQTAYFLSNGLGDYDLAPNRKTAAYYYNTNSKESSLIIDQIPKLDLNRIGRLAGIDNPSISWSPNKRYVAIAQPGKLILYDSYLEKIEEIGSGDYENALISPDSKKIIYTSQHSQDPPPLAIMDVSGENKENLNIKAWLNNITFTDSSNFYGAGKKEDKPILFSCNLSNNKLTLLNWEVDSSEFKDIAISLDNDRLYLIKDNKLVSLEIIEKGY